MVSETVIPLLLQWQEICENIKKNKDNNLFTCSIFIDLAKAFDTVDHSILLHKLQHYGIRGEALSLFTSYLYDRQQFVQIGQCKSNPCKISCGVPQGSVLGPLLFLLYINDLQNASSLQITLFADDTLLSLASSDLNSLKSCVNKELHNVEVWMNSNMLSINISKTNYMLTAPSNRNIQTRGLDLNIKFIGKPLQRTSSCKYLGVILDESIDWKNHVDLLINW